jgi:hypothetical protein
MNDPSRAKSKEQTQVEEIISHLEEANGRLQRPAAPTEWWRKFICEDWWEICKAMMTLRHSIGNALNEDGKVAGSNIELADVEELRSLNLKATVVIDGKIDWRLKDAPNMSVRNELGNLLNDLIGVLKKLKENDRNRCF